jgi:hypothetical protein
MLAVYFSIFIVGLSALFVVLCAIWLLKPSFCRLKIKNKDVLHAVDDSCSTGFPKP